MDKRSHVLEFREVFLETQHLKEMLGTIDEYYADSTPQPVYLDLVGNYILKNEKDFHEIFKILRQPALLKVCVQFGYEFPFVIYNKVMSSMKAEDIEEIDGRISFERPWISPNTRAINALDKIALTLDALNSDMKKNKTGLATVDNWTKHVDESIERIGVRVAMTYENEIYGEDYVSEFIPLGPRGRILNSDNRTLKCQLDGLLLTKDGDFILIEAKMFLNSAQLSKANDTCLNFETYLKDIESIQLDSTKRTTRYNMQVSAFRNKEIFENPPKVVRKYIVSNLYDQYETLDVKEDAVKAGWIIISRHGTEFAVETNS